MRPIKDQSLLVTVFGNSLLNLSLKAESGKFLFCEKKVPFSSTHADFKALITRPFLRFLPWFA